jgi:S-DNA-T family DNA segregation ATPase FtsK/SpoIIIE
VLGHYLLRLFGVAAFVLILISGLWAVNLIQGKRVRGSIRNSAFIALLGLWLGIFLAHFFEQSGFWGCYASGMLGRWIDDGLSFLFGRAGTAVLLFALLVLLAMVLANIDLGAILSRAKPRVRPLKPRPKMRAQPALVSEIPKPTLVIEPPPRLTPERFLGCLAPPEAEERTDARVLEAEAQQLLKKLLEFGVEGRISGVISGPVVSRFEFEPAPGVKVHRIENLADDLALSLKAERIRILAPIPGKSAVGIEIPNRRRRLVYLRRVLTSPQFQSQTSPLSFGLGETITGEPFVADLRQMPHLLIAGTTGSGKSVCINTILISICFRSSPSQVRFVTIDPKRLELPIYDPVPHLERPTTVDPKGAVERLSQVVQVMDIRYRDFARAGTRDIESYNQRAQKEDRPIKPYLLIVVDELADLMLTAPSEIEEKITRLAQMSRAVGIHLVLATQRPSVDVITGLIKANFPARIAFQVASKTDSRTILDMNGAEALLGQGDMLFLPPGKGEPLRLHGAFVSTQEATSVVDLLARNWLFKRLKALIPEPEAARATQAIIDNGLLGYLIQPEAVGWEERRRRILEVLDPKVIDQLLDLGYYPPLPELEGMTEAEIEREGFGETDELFLEAARLVVRHQEASVSMLQRRLDVGWARAGRIIDQLEQVGIVGPYVGSKARKVLVESDEELEKRLKEDFKRRP